jgi:hypothetical protein
MADSENRDHPVHEEQHTVTRGSFVPGEEESETHSQPVGSFADQNQGVDDPAEGPAADGDDEGTDRVGRFSDGPDAPDDYVTPEDAEGSFAKTEDED